MDPKPSDTDSDHMTGEMIRVETNNTVNNRTVQAQVVIKFDEDRVSKFVNLGLVRWTKNRGSRFSSHYVPDTGAETLSLLYPITFVTDSIYLI
ncbi:hypothetical protein PNOK_0205400 [Pyrrhoderma noxium]|uniref:Uncharacterized protein n=1 Tax=Pyrrhoderma noxium TaxID=2282107 RepID=A0A286URB3_9AGAM|nr:hypothetical protein PNOK_0205400 [Pyrrhoderma noxium]